MENNFINNLTIKIKSLPEINHNKNLWDKIANELDFEERLKETSKALPVHPYHEDLWDRIQNSNATRTKYRKIILAVSLAASILLFVVTYTFFDHTKSVSITYSTEILNEKEEIPSDSEKYQNVDLMLRQLCQYSNLDCNTSEFLQINNQLNELEAEIQKLNQVISAYGESPELIKCLIRMENQKSDLVNEFLTNSAS